MITTTTVMMMMMMMMTITIITNASYNKFTASNLSPVKMSLL